MLYIALFILLLAVLLLWQSRRTRREAGIPGGRIIYTDTRGWGPVEKPLFDGELGLTGKPDYLVEQNGVIIPIEVKSGRVAEAPYDSHIFQLAAYCMLVQRQLGKRPPYGILRYANRTFAIDYTPELEKTLLGLLEDMREMGPRKGPDRSHESPARCAHCGYRSICDQKL